MLPFLTNRPLVLTRYPNGIDKEGFYEKDAPKGKPPWIKTMKRYSPTANRFINYLICNDLDTLLWIANLAALEIHVTLARADSFEKPDLVLFDVDPEPPADFDDAIEVALQLKRHLDDLNLKSFVKTSGKKGMHVLVPIVSNYSFAQTRSFVHQIGEQLAKEMPNVVSEFSKTKEKGTVFIDYLQNSHGRTMICPYSLRATPDASVSTPLEWSDINKGLKPSDLNISSVPKMRKEPWSDLFHSQQKLEVEH